MRLQLLSAIPTDYQKGILFFEERNGIMTPAEISPVNGEYQIVISLTFCQFVWAVGLYMTVYFDNIVQIPNMNAAGTNIRGYKANKDYLEYANEQFRLARSLIWGYNHDVFLTCQIFVTRWSLVNQLERLMEFWLVV